MDKGTFEQAQQEIQAGIQTLVLPAIAVASQPLYSQWRISQPSPQRSAINYRSSNGVMDDIAGRRIYGIEVYANCEGGIGGAANFDVVPDGNPTISVFDPTGTIPVRPLGSSFKSNLNGSFVWGSGFELFIQLPVTMRPDEVALPGADTIVNTTFYATVVVYYE